MEAAVLTPTLTPTPTAVIFNQPKPVDRSRPCCASRHRSINPNYCEFCGTPKISGRVIANPTEKALYGEAWISVASSIDSYGQRYNFVHRRARFGTSDDHTHDTI